MAIIPKSTDNIDIMDCMDNGFARETGTESELFLPMLANDHYAKGSSRKLVFMSSIIIHQFFSLSPFHPFAIVILFKKRYNLNLHFMIYTAIPIYLCRSKTKKEAFQ